MEESKEHFRHLLTVEAVNGGYNTQVLCQELLQGKGIHGDSRIEEQHAQDHDVLCVQQASQERESACALWDGAH